MPLLCPLDIETTGFDPVEHRIIELYSEHWDSDTRTLVQTDFARINPLRSIPIEAQRVHGITLLDLSTSPDWETVGPKIHAQLWKADVFIAHNAPFDLGFLNSEFKRIGLAPLPQPFIDTSGEARWATPIGKVPTLQELCWAMEVEYDPALAHAAEYDVHKMMECFWRGVDWGHFTLPSSMEILNAA